jgi:hypothetical protein
LKKVLHEAHRSSLTTAAWRELEAPSPAHAREASGAHKYFAGSGLQRLERLLSRPESDMPVAGMAKLAAATADVFQHGASFLDRPTFCASVASARGRVSRSDQGFSHRGPEPGIALSHRCVHHARLYNNAWVRAGWVPWVPRSQAEKV